MKRGLNGLAALVWLVCWSSAAMAQAPSDSAVLLARTLAGLAERAQNYYDRVSTILCVERVTQQELKFDRTPVGRPRITVYELSIIRDPESKGESEFRVERTLQSVNGRRARKNEEPGCTDPKTGTPEPLGFLLAKNQSGYRFSFAPAASGGPAGAIALDFAQTPADPVSIKWKDNCFDAEGGGLEGRLWFEPATFDVLQIEARLPKPFFVPVPKGLWGAPIPVRVEASTVRMRFTRVKFQKPDETILLPESTDVVTVFRGVPSLHTVQILSNFRRFLAESTVRPATP